MSIRAQYIHYADYSAQPNVSLSLEATAGFFEGLQRVPPTAHRGDTKVAPLIEALANEISWAFVNDGVTTVFATSVWKALLLSRCHHLAL